MFLLTKSECAIPEDIHLQHPFMAILQKFQSISGQGALIKKKNMGMKLFLKKTMSEKLLITIYALRDILPGNANIQKIL